MKTSTLTRLLSLLMTTGNLGLIGFSLIFMVVLGGFLVIEWMTFVVLVAPLTSYVSLRFFGSHSTLRRSSRDTVIDMSFSLLSIAIIIGLLFLLFLITYLASIRYGDVTLNNALISVGVIETMIGGYLAIIERRA